MDDTSTNPAKLTAALRALRPFAIVVLLGVAPVLAVRAWRAGQERRPPPPPPAPAVVSTPEGFRVDDPPPTPPDVKAALQDISAKTEAIKENFAEIQGNLGRLKNEPEKSQTAPPKEGGLSEATEKLRTNLDDFATATAPGGKVDSALESLQRAVAPDGPLATKLKAAEEKTAELAKRRKARPESTPKPRDNR